APPKYELHDTAAKTAAQRPLAAAAQRLPLELLAVHREHADAPLGRDALNLLALAPNPLDQQQSLPVAKDSASADPSLVAALDFSDGMRHWNAITDLAFSPDGRTLISGSLDHCVNVWNPANGQLASSREQSGPVHAVALDPRGEFLAVGGRDAPLRLIHLGDAKKSRVLIQGPTETAGLAWSANGELLVVAGAGGGVWALNPRNPRQAPTQWKFDGPLHAVAVNADGSLIAAGTGHNSVVLWNREGQELRAFTGHAHRVAAVAFSPDGEQLASASWDGTVNLWNLTSDQPPRVFSAGSGKLHALAFSPHGGSLAAAGEPLAAGGDDNRILIWDLKRAERKPRALTGLGSPVLALAYHPNGRVLAVGDASGAARLWNIATGRVAQDAPQFPLEPRSIALSPNGSLLAIGGRGSSVQGWSLHEAQQQFAFWGHDQGITQVAFAPQGNFLVSASEDRTVKVWDVSAGDERHALTGNAAAVTTVAVSPDGRLIASGNANGNVKLWDAASGEKQASWKAHAGQVSQLAFSPDGARLASAGDKTVNTWSVASGKLLASLDQHAAEITSIAWNPVNSQLVSRCENGELKIWDAESARSQTTITVHGGSRGPVAFRHDGRMFATAGADGAIRLWDAESAQSMRRLQVGPAGGVIQQIEFSPDGRYLIALNGNQTVHVLRLEESTLQEWATARWVLRRGGKVQVQSVHEDRTYRVGKLPSLPKEAFQVHKVD
ncbi:MAG: WD40 repeat domain-containing protein, partial [Planctomycetales bacterium]